VHWTGIGVVPHSITTAQAAEAKAAFGHDILIWDNYPVNDYAHGRILLAAYSGREPGLADQVVGVISNSMNQAGVSKLALYSFVEFGLEPGDVRRGRLVAPRDRRTGRGRRRDDRGAGGLRRPDHLRLEAAPGERAGPGREGCHVLGDLERPGRRDR